MKNRSSIRTHGFSLIEVVLAVGVVTFALMTVIGLLPVGLNTFQQAMDQAAEAQILQKLSGEIRGTPFKSIPVNYSAKMSYYDREGREVLQESEASYQVNISLINAVYPGSTNAVHPDTSDPATAIAKNLQGIQIRIARLRSASPTNQFNIQVPNSGD